MESIREKIRELFPIGNREIDSIIEHGDLLYLRRNHILTHHNELNNYIFFILSGSLEKNIILNNGSTKTVWFFLDVLFNILLCYDSNLIHPNTRYEVKSLEKSFVLRMKYSEFNMLTSKYPNLQRIKTHHILYNYMIMNEIRDRIISDNSIDFLQYLKKYYPILLVRIPSRSIAEFMGITPEWFSKLKKKNF